MSGVFNSTSQTCVCDVGWTGASCDTMKRGAAWIAYGLGNSSSWCGSIVEDEAGLFHLFTSEMVNGCGLDTWYSVHSQYFVIVIAVGRRIRVWFALFRPRRRVLTRSSSRFCLLSRTTLTLSVTLRMAQRCFCFFSLARTTTTNHCNASTWLGGGSCLLQRCSLCYRVPVSITPNGSHANACACVICSSLPSPLP